MDTPKERIAEENLIEVCMAQLKLAKAPAIIVTRGLGSCLGITLYDPVKKIGAMAHPMLPDIERAKIKSNPARFVNSVINKMLEELKSEGCLKHRLVAKLFGGAHMFSFIAKDSILNIGEKNIDMAKLLFKQYGIDIAVEELGGNAGRTIEFNLETGKVRVKTISRGEKEV
ncbi:chemotaxis protein CheD [Candidatus Omnitrophota bacterium]